ncbi:amidase family protein [Streptomyces sp. NBC_00243]|uniref:amidase n=1 Tax=Streptomyces sp. NBC_00243 TaxID=2975688 RepID=UPI002DDB1AC3|nr:amidase family protein [Streptomyces sp. NBC_00243]WRZ17361.1 amidase family protein [Streptomyces sp. NBC_00243]
MTARGIHETRTLLSHRNISVADHVESVLTDIRKNNPELGAYVSVAADDAAQEASMKCDELIATLGPEAWRDHPLLGVTVSVKDLLQTQDLPTTRGSRLRNRRPRIDAPAVARLRAAGAIIIGKTTTSEYGWSASTVSPVAPPTRNPWAPDRTAGGSSGGAAASVAAGLCSAALGTDGAGSIRIPSSFCGVVGFKPSFGRVPYVPAGADRLSHVGPIAGNVRDVRALTSVLAGPHRDDPDSGIGSFAPLREPPGLRIGWLDFPGTSAEVRAVCERVLPILTAQGHRVEQMPSPFADPYPALVDILAAAEAAGTPPEDEDDCDPGRLAVVRYGRTVSGASVLRAEETRLALRRRLASIMDCYEILAMPTVPIEPFAADAIAPPDAEDPNDLRWLSWAPASYPFNMTGQPALSLPVGFTKSGLPVGLQLVGPLGMDDLVLGAAARIEADLGPLTHLTDHAMKGQL